MHRAAITAGLVIALSTHVLAAERKLTGAEIISILSDRTLTADGEIEQIFQPGGQTVYIERGNVSQGQWRVQHDQYCSVWPPSEFWACYDVLQEGEVVTFISRSGTRFPMKLPLEN